MDFNWINTQNTTETSDLKNAFDCHSISTYRLVNQQHDNMTITWIIALNAAPLSKPKHHLSVVAFSQAEGKQPA